METIDMESQSIEQLFSGVRYGVDSYQREYKWEKDQIEDLATDLRSVFDADYKVGDAPESAESYGSYFLGPIIIDTSKTQHRIIDGQQRLTTISLVLICLYHRVKEGELRSKLRRLAYPDEDNVLLFIPHVEERSACLLHLLDSEDESFDVDDPPESDRNLVERFSDVKEKLTSTLPDDQVPVFARWFIQKVRLARIAVPSSEDAYTIFETMNDRGLNLTPAEMLKSYLLSKIGDARLRDDTNDAWKKIIDVLSKRKNEDANVIKTWLRARHAKKKSLGGKLSDFDAIGSQFHRWVRDNKTVIGLNDDNTIVHFITHDFDFYTKEYLDVRKSAEDYAHAKKFHLERIYYLAQHSFTLQYPLLLAPLERGDSDENKRKMRVVAAYLDIMVHRRIGHGKEIAERSMRPRIFGLIPEIRSKSAQDIATHLVKKLKAENQEEEWDSTFAPQFGLHPQNGPRIRRVLSRITDYVQVGCSEISRYDEYFLSGSKSFDIEHIWHDNHAKVCKEECMSQSRLNKYDFKRMRDQIGGLLLLSNKDNRACGGKSYAKKRGVYLQSNRLAASLHEDSDHLKGFRDFKKDSGFPFKAHEKFDESALEQRQTLYRKIADKIWHPDILHKEANAD